MLFSLIKLFGTFICRDLRRNVARTIITISGIALGVAVLLAISLANHTALDKFKETVDRVAGEANLEIQSISSARLDENLLYKIRWLPMVATKFTAIIEENVMLRDEDGPVVQLIGIDMLCDPEFKTYDDSASQSGRSTDVLAPNAALIGSRLAAEQKVSVGDTLTLLINEHARKLKVVRIMSSKGLGGAFSGNLIVTDIRTAQECLDMPGKITRVEIIAPPEELSDIQEKLRHDLPLDVSVERPSQRGVQVENMTRSFECNLLALTFIALMVGMFLIYNTMTISVIRRRTEIGTLRAIGVSRGKVLALFLLEAFAFGVVGTALGIVGGILFAQGALDSIAKTFEHFYFKEPIETVIVNPVILLGAFALGVTLTVAAAFAPAMEAASVAPAEAARRASYEMKTSRSAGRLAIYAFTVLALAAIAAAQPPVNGLPVFGYVASLATIIGCALLMPQTLKSILPPLSCICERLFSAEGRIAARSLYGTLGRTSVATASLMIGIAMMVSLAIMIGSFRQTVMMWVDQSLKADLFIQTAARSGGSKQARLQEATVQAIRSTPGVEAVDAFVEQPILYNGERTNLAAGEFDVVGKYGHLLFRSGEDARKLCSSMTNKDCLVSEPFAIRRHVKEGDTIQLMTPKGVEAFFVRGVYYEYASDLGYVTITRSKYIDLFGDTSVSSCAVYVKSGADPDKVRAEIMRRIPSATRLAINTTGSIRKEALIVFDRTFAITYALHAIAIAVALLSVINALFALVMEFKRDFGILRYVGATQQQLRRIVLVEAGLLGAIGNAGGLVLGYLLSLLLIYVINKQSFGWTVQFSFPWVFIAQSGLLVFGTALLAGLIPARIAANTVAPSVVRDE